MTRYLSMALSVVTVAASTAATINSATVAMSSILSASSVPRTPVKAAFGVL